MEQMEEAWVARAWRSNPMAFQFIVWHSQHNLEPYHLMTKRLADRDRQNRERAKVARTTSFHSFDAVQERYDRGLKEKYTIDSSVGAPSEFMPVFFLMIGSVAFFAAPNLSTGGLVSWGAAIALLAAIFSSVFAVLALMDFITVTDDSAYQYFGNGPGSNLWIEFEASHRDYYERRMRAPFVDAHAASETARVLAKAMMAIILANEDANDDRRAKRHSGFKNLRFAIIFLIVAAVFSVTVRATQPMLEANGGNQTQQ